MVDWFRVVACALAFTLLPMVASASPFVTVRDGRFVTGEVPFRFAGANVSVMHGARERAALETTLDAVVADGGRVIRIWALGEAPSDSPAWRRDYAFRLGPDGFVDDTFAHLDAVLDAARARDLRVIVVLANRWHDYGGFPEYARWAELDVPYEPNGDLPFALLGRFYSSERAQALYQAHVRRVVTRVNARSGLAYRDDPTVFAWELANETSAQAEEDEEALVAWTRAQAAFIKALDPNHLVSAGHIGYDTLRERSTWLRVQALADIDYADTHVYPLGDPRVRSKAALVRYIGDRIALAHGTLHKPLVFGEFGFDTDRASRHGRSRVAWTRDFLVEVARLGVAGALVWFYEPAAASTRRHTIPAVPSMTNAPIRVALRASARAFANDVPPASIRADTTPVFTEREVLRGTRVHTFAREGDGFILRADPFAFAEAAFERVSVYAGPPVAHLWGVGEGSVTYLFRAPTRGAPSRLDVALYASSELHGRGLGARATETSLVRVAIDGVDVGTFVAPVDDGLGHEVNFSVTDAAVLERLFETRSRVHRLTLHASSRPNAGGLCIYGAVSPEAAASVPSSDTRLSSFRLAWATH